MKNEIRALMLVPSLLMLILFSGIAADNFSRERWFFGGTSIGIAVTFAISFHVNLTEAVRSGKEKK